MGILDKVISVFDRGKPKNPNEFVKKFLRDSKRERAQLEMIYEREAILQVDALRFVPSWFKITTEDREKYKDGYVIYFTKEIEKFQKDFAKKYFCLSEENDLIKIEERHNDEDVITVCKFLESIESHLTLANEMRNFIDGFYSFKENNPSIIYNIRYLAGVLG